MKKVLIVVFVIVFFVVFVVVVQMVVVFIFVLVVVVFVLFQGQVNIVVGSLKCKVEKCYGGLGEGIGDVLIIVLFNIGKFVVYECENIVQLIEEVFFNGGVIFQGVDVLIFGVIMQYEFQVFSGGLLFMGVLVGKKSSIIVMDLCIVDVKICCIIGVIQVQGKVEGNNFNVSGLLFVNVGVQLSFQFEVVILQMLNNVVQQLFFKVLVFYYKE